MNIPIGKPSISMGHGFQFANGGRISWESPFESIGPVKRRGTWEMHMGAMVLMPAIPAMAWCFRRWFYAFNQQ